MRPATLPIGRDTGPPGAAHADARRAGGPLLALAWLAAVAAFACLPLVVGESWLFLCSDFLIMALFAMSYNLLFGHTGMLSFGHAAFYGVGAYTVALLYDRLGIGVFPGILFAPVAAGLVALAVGFFTVRVTGMYFAMLTLAFAQLLYTLVLGWYDFTGGDNGLPVMPSDALLPAANFFYFTLATVAVSIALLWMFTRSAFGVALAAMRENPQRAATIGIDLRLYQVAAFVISGAFAGVAGGLKAPLQQMAFPSLLHWTQSAEPVLMALAGGAQTFAGPIIGAAIFVFLNFLVTTYTDYPLLVFGLLVLVVVLFMPGGVAGALSSLPARLRRRGPLVPDRRDA